MLRAFVSRFEGRRAHLDNEEIHHLVKVRRARQGEQFEGFDGTGQHFLCQLAKDELGWHGVLVRAITEPRESPLRIHLGLSLIKREPFEWSLQKSVELGVSSLTPIVSQRTEIHLGKRRREQKQERWSKVIREAVKQSRRVRLPELNPVSTIDEALSRFEPCTAVALDGQTGVSIRQFTEGLQTPSADSILLFVGPEGGWGPRDRHCFERASVQLVNLGTRTLRAETAPLVALAILQYSLGDLV